MKTKIQAIREIIWDANNKKPSKTSLKRVRQAGKILGLTDEEQIQLENVLDYRGFSTNELYQRFQ